MTTVLIIILLIGIIAGLVASHDIEEHRAQARKLGRGGLWLICPPLGLWRSWKHGANKRDERLAEMINKKDQ